MMIEKRWREKKPLQLALDPSTSHLKREKKKRSLTGGPGTRGAAVAFGAGFGLGSAYADGRKEVSICCL